MANDQSSKSKRNARLRERYRTDPAYAERARQRSKETYRRYSSEYIARRNERIALGLRKPSFDYEAIKADPSRLARLKATQAAYKKRPDISLARQEEKARMRAMRAGVRCEVIDYVEVLTKANGLCGICGEPFNDSRIEFDHKVAISHGGDHVFDNVQAAHGRCNQAKGHWERRTKTIRTIFQRG